MKSSVIKALSILSIALASLTASAVPIQLGGEVNGTPANEASEYARLLLAIAAYETANSVDLPAPIGQSVHQSPTETDKTHQGITLSADDCYVLFASASQNIFFYVNGFTGLFDFVNTIANQNGNIQDISHFSVFQCLDTTQHGVPDSGATIALLAGSVAVLGALRRKIS
jgi:hypothetical protein